MTPSPLDRFVQAQDPVYPTVLQELLHGRKHTHWIWFIFPQLAGLGRSSMSQKYALSGLPEAAAYLAHPVLGPHLLECVGLIHALQGREISSILPTPDDLKFRSCLTLFSRVPGASPLFHACLEKYFGGIPDPLTLRLLKEESICSQPLSPCPN